MEVWGWRCIDRWREGFCRSPKLGAAKLKGMYCNMGICYHVHTSVCFNPSLLVAKPLNSVHLLSSCELFKYMYVFVLIFVSSV